RRGGGRGGRRGGTGGRPGDGWWAGGRRLVHGEVRPGGHADVGARRGLALGQDHGAGQVVGDRLRRRLVGGAGVGHDRLRERPLVRAGAGGGDLEAQGLELGGGRGRATRHSGPGKHGHLDRRRWRQRLPRHGVGGGLLTQ